MKVHLLFKRPEAGDVNIMQLYAYSPHKSDVEEFLSMRDPDKFIYRKLSLTKSEYKTFDNERHEHLLHRQKFRTKLGDSCHLSHQAEILCTYEEENQVFIKGENVILQELSRHLPNPKVFNPEFLPALDTLLYIKFYGFFKHGNHNFDVDYYEPYFSSYAVSDILYEDVHTSYELDQVSVFLLLHGWTFK